MFRFLLHYKTLERPVLFVIAAEFFIQLVNATFMNMLPLYLNHLHYNDEDIAGFLAFRFLGVFILALPMGILIKGRRVKPLFYISALCVPLFALGILFAIENGNTGLIYLFQLLWGASFTFMQIPVLPFVIRNCSLANQTAGIALSYSTWSFAGILSGVLIVVLDYINPLLFDERMVLILITCLGFLGIFMLLAAGGYKENVTHEAKKTSHHLGKYEWPLIIKALTPTLIIAVGAGLTIQFISLFFAQVHHMDKGTFSIISSGAALLVAWAALLVPVVKKTIGYKIAVPTTQSLAIISLVALATTQYYNQMGIAVVIAVICYLLRQPLMNMAGPMTSEIVMNYVGDKNREIVSALTSAIWSGSWFVSGLLVQLMFANGLQFVNIFLITALLYTVGVIWYSFLIRDYERKAL